MKPIYCPKCHKLLMNASLIDAEIKCKGCKRIVKVKMYSQSQLLTASHKVNTIEV